MNSTLAAAENTAEQRNIGLLNRIAWLLWVIVLALVGAFCFFASSLCVTFLLAAFLAILVDPVISKCERWLVPRPVSAAVLILASMFALGVLGYESYVMDVPVGHRSRHFRGLPAAHHKVLAWILVGRGRVLLRRRRVRLVGPP